MMRRVVELGEADEGRVVALPTRSSETFESFYQAEHDALFGAMYLIAGSRQEAEELMQEAFLRVWERWDSVEGHPNPTGYLYRTAMNVFRMRYRRAKVAAKRLVGLAPPSDAFDAVDARDQIDRVLASLTPRQRAALVLTELVGLTSEEAGQALGVASSTVRVLASRARDAIRSREEPG
jgi:RNA polymerase sigma factor (sigma-70 family)